MADKEFDKFLSGLTKKYGEDLLTIPKVTVVSHPSIGINVLTGIQGLPLGRIMEFFGPEHGGKTTIALLAIAAANREGKRCFYCDLEAALDKDWAVKLGVDWNLTTYFRPPNGEVAFDIIQQLAESKFYSLGVVDSVAAIVSEVEITKDLGDTKDRVGGFSAKIMSSGLRKLVPVLGKNNLGVIFINQVRDNIGVMYGDKESTPGGRALKFYASMRLRVNKLNAKDKVYMRGNIQIGHVCSVTIRKNKHGAPDKRGAEFNLYYDFGIDTITEIINWAHDLNLLKKRGDIITYQEVKFTVAEFNEKLLDDTFREELVQSIYANSRGDAEGTIEETDEQETLEEEGLE